MAGDIGPYPRTCSSKCPAKGCNSFCRLRDKHRFHLCFNFHTWLNEWWEE